ncbi:hypothetical protein [Cupriavidus campinensis]|uniref:AlpA family phage regulatory protein n=1 Tax=Cupriavidus campinensis TaxID=151783 RepID=A0ABY3EKK7_9BURK|nr:hypothetical protein [Cupriavidus campinensis]TSP11476.1 hypothetical protein FGG12_17725 [Cupriavidus campinensis]
MSEADLIERIADTLEKRAALSYRLWTIEMIATYLNRNADVVRQRIVSLPTFPKAIRLPAGDGRVGKPQWKAQEVIEWVESHKEGAGTRRG